MYGKNVPIAKLMDPKTKEEVTVNETDVAEWLKAGYVTIGGTVAVKATKASKVEDGKASSEE